MKKRGIVIFLMYLLLLSNIVLAESKIQFRHIEINDFISPGNDLIIKTTIKNIGTRSLNNLKITATLLSIDLRTSKTSEKIIIGDTETTALIIYIDKNVKPGVYYLRIIAEDGNIRRATYREVVIK